MTIVFWRQETRESFVCLREAERDYSYWRFASGVRRSILKREVVLLDRGKGKMRDQRGFEVDVTESDFGEVLTGLGSWVRL